MLTSAQNVWEITKWKVEQNKDTELLRPFSDATRTGIQFGFTSSWVKQAPGREREKKTKCTTDWRVATRRQWKTNVCETLTNDVKAGAWSVRDRRAIGGAGVRGSGGRVEGVNSVSVNSLNWESGSGRKVAVFRSRSETCLCVWSAHTCKDNTHSTRSRNSIADAKKQ